MAFFRKEPNDKTDSSRNKEGVTPPPASPDQPPQNIQPLLHTIQGTGSAADKLHAIASSQEPPHTTTPRTVETTSAVRFAQREKINARIGNFAKELAQLVPFDAIHTYEYRDREKIIRTCDSFTGSNDTNIFRVLLGYIATTQNPNELHNLLEVIRIYADTRSYGWNFNAASNRTDHKLKEFVLTLSPNQHPLSPQAKNLLKRSPAGRSYLTYDYPYVLEAQLAEIVDPTTGEFNRIKLLCDMARLSPQCFQADASFWKNVDYSWVDPRVQDNKKQGEQSPSETNHALRQELALLRSKVQQLEGQIQEGKMTERQLHEAKQEITRLSNKNAELTNANQQQRRRIEELERIGRLTQAPQTESQKGGFDTAEQFLSLYGLGKIQLARMEDTQREKTIAELRRIAAISFHPNNGKFPDETKLRNINALLNTLDPAVQRNTTFITGSEPNSNS